VLLKAADAQITRALTMTDSAGVPGTLGPNTFIINHRLFKLNYIDYQVPLNNTEIWQITNSTAFGHPFHIHDVEFNIISVNGAAPTAAQAGWKDVVFVPGATGGGPGGGGTPYVIKFIAKFDDYADALHPFMYHCHISLHEDEGMMGQFVVTDPKNQVNITENVSPFSLYPNPANNTLYFNFSNPNQNIYYVRIVDAVGRTVLMLPAPDLSKGIDISEFNSGIYTVILTDGDSKKVSTQNFVKE
jgi:hypothetical protein